MPVTTQLNNPIKRCIKCDCELKVGTNWTEYKNIHHDYVCRKCSSKRGIQNYRKLHNSTITLMVQKNNPIKYCRVCSCELNTGSNWTIGREKQSMYICNKCELNRTNNWARANPEKRLISNKKACKKSYHKNPEDYKARVDTRRRGYGQVILFDNPFPDDIPVVGHHISDGFKVYLPKSLHLNHLHGTNKQLHREELKPYVESIYNINYVIEEV